MNVETKHTPGPWRAIPCDNGFEADVIDAGGYIIAGCAGGAGPDGTENAMDNAHLIAAAPDLLEALKEQVESCWSIDCEMCARHKVILDKATGET